MSIYCHKSEEEINNLIGDMSARGWEYETDRHNIVEFVSDDSDDTLKLKNWDEVEKYVDTHEEF